MFIFFYGNSGAEKVTLYPRFASALIHIRHFQVPLRQLTLNISCDRVTGTPKSWSHGTRAVFSSLFESLLFLAVPPADTSYNTDQITGVRQEWPCNSFVRTHCQSPSTCPTTCASMFFFHRWKRSVTRPRRVRWRPTTICSRISRLLPCCLLWRSFLSSRFVRRSWWHCSARRTTSSFSIFTSPTTLPIR